MRRWDGAREMTAFTDAYDDRVQEVMDEIDAIRGTGADPL